MIYKNIHQVVYEHIFNVTKKQLYYIFFHILQNPTAFTVFQPRRQDIINIDEQQIKYKDEDQH